MSRLRVLCLLDVLLQDCSCEVCLAVRFTGYSPKFFSKTFDTLPENLNFQLKFGPFLLVIWLFYDSV